MGDDAQRLEEIRKVFVAVDTDGNEFITRDELYGMMKQLLKREVTMEEVNAMGNRMDENGDGRISFEEFSNTMLAWLKSSSSNKLKRMASTEPEDRDAIRRRVHSGIVAFFQEAGVSDSFDGLHSQILSSKSTDVLDMESLREGFQVLAAEERVALLEQCKRIMMMDDAQGHYQRMLHSNDPQECLQAAKDMRTLLRMAGTYSAGERQKFKTSILTVFEGVTNISNPPVIGSDGRPLCPIIHRLCQIVKHQAGADRSVFEDIKIIALEALYYYTLGPRIPYLHEDNIWHDQYKHANQAVHDQGIPIYVLEEILRSSVALNPVLVDNAVKLIGAFSESHRESLEHILTLGARQDVLRLLKQGSIPLDLRRSCLYVLSILCGYTHRDHLDNPLEALNLAEDDVLDIIQTCANLLSYDDDACICSAILILRIYLPMLNPSDETYKLYLHLIEMLQKQWNSEDGAKFAVEAITLCLQQALRGTPSLLENETLSSFITRQLLNDDHAGIVSVSLDIVDTCVSVELIQYMEQFLRPLIILVKATESNRLQKKGLEILDKLSRTGDHHLGIVVTRGGVAACASTFHSFKQLDKSLLELFDATQPFVYDTDLLELSTELLSYMLRTMVRSRSNTLLEHFNLYLVERISQLHLLICNDIERGRLGVSDKVIALCEHLATLLADIKAAFVKLQPPFSRAIIAACDELLESWTVKLENAQASFSGSMGTGTTAMEVASMTLWVLVEPQWTTPGGGKDVRKESITTSGSLQELSAHFKQLFRKNVTLQYFDSDVGHNVTIDSDALLVQVLTRYQQSLPDRLPDTMERNPLKLFLLNTGPVLAQGASDSLAGWTGVEPTVSTAIPDTGRVIHLLKASFGEHIHINGKMVHQINQFFTSNGITTVSVAQFKQALDSIGLQVTDEQAEQMYNAFDENKDGTLTFQEVVIGLTRLMSGDQNMKLKIAFDAFDTDGSGFIDFDELVQLIMSVQHYDLGLARQMAQQTFEKFDANGDGHLNFQEFQQAVHRGTIKLPYWTDSVQEKLAKARNGNEGRGGKYNEQGGRGRGGWKGRDGGGRHQDGDEFWGNKKQHNGQGGRGRGRKGQGNPFERQHQNDG